MRAQAVWRRLVQHARRLRPGLRLGVAIAPHGLWAVRLRRDGSAQAGTSEWRALEPPPPTGTWTSLEHALEHLRSDLDVQGGRLDVALLPPLAEMRRLELPPLHVREVTGVVARGAERYLPCSAEKPTLALTAAPGSRYGRTSGAVLVTSAADRVVEQVEAAARAAGWRIRSVRAAQAAWLAPLDPPHRLLRRRGSSAASGAVLVAGDGRADLLARGPAGEVVLRRLPLCGAVAPTASQLANLLSQAGLQPGVPVTVLAAPALLESFASALRLAGYAPVGSAAPEAAAAAAAARAPGEGLVSERSRVHERRRDLRLAGGLAAAAVLVLALAAGTELWGTRRALARVRAERPAHAREVAAAMAWRDSAEAAHAAADEIERIAAGSTRWSVVIADFAERLPRDTWLAWLHGGPDSVAVEASGASAGAALRDLGRSPVLRGVRLTGAIRRELRDGDEPLEHFGVASALVWREEP